jgi:cell division protein FtsW
MAHAPSVNRLGNYDRLFVLLLAIILMAGLNMVFSATFLSSCQPDKDGIPGDALTYFRSHSLHLTIGLILLIIISFIRPIRFQQIALPALLVFGITGYLAALYGPDIKGAQRWFEIFNYKFQPSEFAKLFLVVYYAVLLSKTPLSQRPAWGKLIRLVAIPLVLLLIPLGLQGDYGTFILVFMVTLAMAYLGGAPLWLLAGILIVGFVGVTGYVAHDPVRYTRILAWQNPEAYTDKAGFHILSMLVTIARGGWCGVGLGLCPASTSGLPEPYTDSIFAVLSSELGLLFGSLPFLLLIGLLVHRIYYIGQLSRDNFGYFLCAGLATMLGFQALINLMVATKIMPVTGLTLPFISAGGSSLISYLIAAGMVLSIYRYHIPPGRK